MYTSSRRLVAFYALTMVALTACGGGSSDVGTPGGNNPNPNPNPNPPPPPPPPISQQLLFFDDFEYDVSRTTAASNDSYNTFLNQGGWSHAKAINLTGSHAGYLYTTTGIPGYNGTFPGRSSNRVLAIEARPGTFQAQTDFYLQYGRENGPADAIPANVWFQFWIYPNNYQDPNGTNSQQSRFHGRFKFIYPCNAPYPCTNGNSQWLMAFGHTTGEPHWANQDPARLYMTNTDTNITTNAMGQFESYIDYLLASNENQWKIGQHNVGEYLVSNRWTLVKLHIDTSTASGSYEAWLRPLGGAWVKVADWRDGVTANFQWRLPSGRNVGHRVFRMPTTMDTYDSWIYLDDFAMANAESELPVYP